MVKSLLESLGFLAAFMIASNYQAILRITVTAMFGASLMLTGGCIVFDKLPSKAKKGQSLSHYLPYLVMISALTSVGVFV